SERVERLVEPPFPEAASRWSAVATILLLVASTCAFVPSIAASHAARVTHRVEAPRQQHQPTVDVADRLPSVVASPAAATVHNVRDRIPAARVAPTTPHPAEITVAVAAEPISAEESPPGAAAPALAAAIGSIEHASTSAPVSPIHDAIARLVIDDVPEFGGRE